MLKVGLYGYQVWYHSLAFAEELKKSNSVKIISVFDEDPKQAKRLGEVAAKHKELKIYTDLDEFAKSDIDFAILTCLPSRRIEAVKKLASRKKHLLIDKPISSTSAGALEIIKICKSENVKLMVGYNIHWAKSLKFAKEVLDEGSLGKPLYGFFAYDGPMLQESEWSKSPGWRMDRKENMSAWFTHADHGIDIFMWLLESHYIDVSAQILNLAHTGFDSFDWGTANFSMENGARIIIKSDAITPSEFEILNIRIICEKGGIVFDYFPESNLQIFIKGSHNKKVTQHKFRDDWHSALGRMAEEFTIYIKEDRPIPYYQSGEVAGYRVLKAAETAHLSSKKNKKLTIPYKI